MFVRVNIWMLTLQMEYKNEYINFWIQIVILLFYHLVSILPITCIGIRGLLSGEKEDGRGVTLRSRRKSVRSLSTGCSSGVGDA